MQDTGLSFNTPQSKRRGSNLGTPGGGAGGSGGAGLTPSKLLLMHGERQMNMLEPEGGSNLFQVCPSPRSETTVCMPVSRVHYLAHLVAISLQAPPPNLQLGTRCVLCRLQMDIETGKTVAEWGFQKDGTDVSMKDLVNDTKGVPQLAVGTFL